MEDVQHVELELCADGTHTLFVPALEEHYHSTRGAVQESLYVYIERGLQHCAENPCTVLEVGFGTGLNALLSAIYAIEHNRNVHFVSYEKFPLAPEIATQLNYADFVETQYAPLLAKIHRAAWNEVIEITPQFTLHKIHSDLTLLPPLIPCNLIYYDAFAPGKQPEMWSEKLLSHVCSALQANGFLVTYCAQGQVRRTLKSFGLHIERLPGPPGKWEMLRATKIMDI
ncbi:MAG: tRNA (5-methylaminomethyl-2-thiouridine)(34)-methyltransferase MnmD [Bacteroidales bacterium]|jgi:tRNA U34 5-methylaminomethyl-2-thiouridine-forming methyltransferase MnmC|nr:tRNA (5-methylaminomethyl-2-thiouridine)(34)-methyltransferase MnmD [Bacteroidales bacterium]